MAHLQELAERYLNGLMTANEFVLAAALEISHFGEPAADTLAFLISYGEMPQPDTGRA